MMDAEETGEKEFAEANSDRFGARRNFFRDRESERGVTKKRKE